MVCISESRHHKPPPVAFKIAGASQARVGRRWPGRGPRGCAGCHTPVPPPRSRSRSIFALESCRTAHPIIERECRPAAGLSASVFPGRPRPRQRRRPPRPEFQQEEKSPKNTANVLKKTDATPIPTTPIPTSTGCRTAANSATAPPLGHRSACSGRFEFGVPRFRRPSIGCRIGASSGLTPRGSILPMAMLAL